MGDVKGRTAVERAIEKDKYEVKLYLDGIGRGSECVSRYL